MVNPAISAASHMQQSSFSVGLNKVSQGVQSALGSMKGCAIAHLSTIPFSSRSIPANLVKTPMRLVQSGAAGIQQGLKKGSISDAASAFRSTLKTHVQKDWSMGIDDIYKDVTKDKHKEEGQKAVKENIKYCGFMYMQDVKTEKNPNAVGIRAQETSSDPDIPPDNKQAVANMTKNLEHMGFQQDARGKFYHPDTGTVFSLIYDKSNPEKPEIVACFEGLGNAVNLVDPETLQFITEDKARPLNDKACSAAVSESLGYVTPSALQAIEVGKLIKGECEKTKNLTPAVVGHSHGGGLAQCAALANGIKGCAFNSRPMGVGMRLRIGQDTLAKNADKVALFSGKGDWLSHNKPLTALAVVTERLTGFMVPRSVGIGYRLPPAEDIGDKKTDQHGAFNRQMQNALR